MRHERIAVLGVPLPEEDFDVRDRMSRTIPGVGDCPQRDGCMLEVSDRIESVRKEIMGELAQQRRALDLLLQARGIRNTDSTPAKGTLDVSAGPVKLHGRAWLVAALALAIAVLVTASGSVAYVLGEWGRPTATAKP